MNHGNLEDSQNLVKERSDRLRRLRNLANLSRKELCEGADINLNTYIGYEVGKYGGLNQKGAEKVIRFIASKGVYSNIEWLMYGIGPSPQVITNINEVSINDECAEATSIEKHNITEELYLFHKHYKNAIDCRVNDDGMSPKYEIGDFVAGVRHSRLFLRDLVGSDCIVQIEEEAILVRALREGRKDGLYTLMCTNPKTSVIQPIVYDVNVIFAAPIIWYRRVYKKPIKNSQSVKGDVNNE